jgi:hypothetical protein
MEQEADGFLFRAQDEITKKHDLKAGREDLKHAKQIYLTIQHYDDVPKRLHLVAMDERALNPPPPPKPVATKPAAKKPVSATSTRRAQAWQSPKAGKRKIK